VGTLGSRIPGRSPSLVSRLPGQSPLLRFLATVAVQVQPQGLPFTFPISICLEGGHGFYLCLVLSIKLPALSNGLKNVDYNLSMSH
jgi:hypothetical protein